MPPKLNIRGERSRQNLLETATRLFSERGFEGTSTRDIVTAAGTTLPLITHYFQSKEGLYRAVLQAGADDMQGALAAASAAAESSLDQHRTRDEKLEALAHLLCAHAHAFLLTRNEWGRLIAYEELQPSGALTPIDEIWETRLFEPIRRLVAELRNLPPDSPDATIEALALLGRVMIFRNRRPTALRLLGEQDMTPEVATRIVHLLGKEVREMFSQR